MSDKFKNRHAGDKHKDKEDQATELLEHPTYQEMLKKLDEAERKADEHWQRILRMQADSENAARRAKLDVEKAHKYALEKFVDDLIPIVDSLELCVANVPANLDSKGHAVIEGVNLTLKMFLNALDKYAVKQVNPVSQPFDPEFEQAISVQYDPKLAPNTVVSVLQKGYTLNNRLIRPALVVVSTTEKQ